MWRSDPPAWWHCESHSIMSPGSYEWRQGMPGSRKKKHPRRWSSSCRSEQSTEWDLFVLRMRLRRLWVLQAVLGSPHTRSRRALPGGAIWLPQAGRAALTQLVAASWPFSGTAVLWCRYCNPSEMHRYLPWKLDRKEVSLGKQQNNLCSSSRGKISTWRYLAAAN